MQNYPLQEPIPSGNKGIKFLAESRKVGPIGPAGALSKFQIAHLELITHDMDKLPTWKYGLQYE